MRKAYKWVIAALAVPFVLFILLAIIIYLPPVQNWLVNKVTEYASEETGMTISVKRVSLAFPLNLDVEQFLMTQPNDSINGLTDTIADVKSLVVDVKLLPLLKKQVEIDAFEFNDLKVNTANLIHEARIKGFIHKMNTCSHGIDLSAETVRIDNALLKDADVSVELSDTVPEDTTKSETKWKIAVDNLDINNTGITIHMPGDTLRIASHINSLTAQNGFFDLYENVYKLRYINISDSKANYDNMFVKPVKGLDTNHISVENLNITIDSLEYNPSGLNMNLRSCSFKEKSGITLDRLSSHLTLDTTRIIMPDLRLSTPNSNLNADITLDLDAFDEKNPGRMNVVADGNIGKQDIMLFLGNMPTAFIRQWPNYPLSVKTVVVGNMKHLNIRGLNVKLPTSFNLSANGYVANLYDPKHIDAQISANAKAYNMRFVEALAYSGSKPMFKIPSGTSLVADVKLHGRQCTADVSLSEGRGRIRANADVNIANMSYDIKATANQFNVSHFLPAAGVGSFNGKVALTGCGTDYMSPKTHLNAKAEIGNLAYGKHNLNNLKLNAYVNNGKAHANISSNNRYVKGIATLDALVSRKMIKSTFTLDLDHADWHALQLTAKPFTTSMCCHIDFATDMKDLILAEGNIGSIVLVDSGKTYRPDDIAFKAYTARDTTRLSMECGDFEVRMHAQGGYKRLIGKSQSFANELVKEINQRSLNFITLRSKLPLADLYLQTGDENPFGRLLEHNGYAFNNIDVNIKSSPLDGLNGHFNVNGFKTSSLQLDTIRFYVASDSTQCKYSAQVRNNKHNKQYVFNALLDGYMFEKGLGAEVKVYDNKDRLGLKVGAEAALEENGIRLHMLTDKPVLGYKEFNVNKDNYVYMGKDRRISANISLVADDQMAARLYTNDENEEALQDLTLSLNKFDLEKVLSVIPYMPRITGMMDGDFHVIQTPDELSVSSSMSVKSMTYENSRMGDISTEFVYMPKDDGSHCVDGLLFCNDVQVADVYGTYRSVGEGELDVQLDMKHLPMRLVNGFIPDRLLRFRGYADGSLSVKGTLSHPQANGEITLDSCYMRSSVYGINLALDKGPIRIVGSNLIMENFKMYAADNSPLDINGNIDFSDLANMMMNLNMKAKNFRIIDSKERRRSVAFGKAYIDLLASLKGPVNDIKMSGFVKLLGSTDLSYILRDSPLTTDNKMDELVKFVSFEDTTETEVVHEPMTGFNMDVRMSIDKGAHVMCYLNADHSNYLDLTGGGDLRMTYNPNDDFRLTGRYTLGNGEMKYSLPVIPLKTFTITDGSYIEFTGDPMNPRLNITATERTKANVSTDGTQGRSVEFDCGVVITKTLSDMGLQFILDAPEDMTIQNELNAMSIEQRGKIAVTMLTTGMYIADGNTGGFSMNNALSSFLQSEINNITGNALRTLDLSFGMDNSQDASGNTHTDYSFKFSKRFWNNRLRIVIGGKVSTGAEIENQNESFFDNVTFEYRLGETSDKYLKLFYDNNAYDWLEGNTSEYGVGFMWRKSLQHFNELFKFNKKEEPKKELPTK